MHDLFEGVVPYELKLLIRHCVRQHYFSIDELNERILQFDFGDNKPAQIDHLILSRPVKKIRQSASQMVVLSRTFPLLIGDRIPVGKNWESWLLLLKICSIIIIALSPICTHDTVAYLRVLAEEKLYTFKTLYPDVTVTPKLHYMIHYPMQSD